MKEPLSSSLFCNEIEDVAIERIKKFYKIAQTLGLEVAVGFSGGKDSQVVYDLCTRSGIPFTAYYNVSFESNVTKKFIRTFYPEVVWRRDHKFGFIENISKNHAGILPTVEMAYCCSDYKHNPKYVDKCSIIGVRRQESNARASRTTLSFRNKTTKKQLSDIASNYFIENCQSTGTASIIQLLPIVDWNDSEVWDYIYKHSIPINPEYQSHNRVGCIICPKRNFTHNYKSLIKYPKLIDAVLKAKQVAPNCDYVITSDNKDYSNDKVYYICRWLIRSFRPFTKRQLGYVEQVRLAYEKSKKIQTK